MFDSSIQMTIYYFIYVLAYIGLGLSLMVFNFQQYFSHIVALSWIDRRNRRIRRKPHTCRVTNKRYHIMLYTSPWSRFELTPSVVIGTDYIKNNKAHATWKTREMNNIDPITYRWWAQVLRMGKQSLSLIRHPICYSYDKDMLDTNIRGRRVRDRMVVGLPTTYAISGYQH
jgi:hypothetical protein